MLIYVVYPLNDNKKRLNVKQGENNDVAAKI